MTLSVCRRDKSVVGMPEKQQPFTMDDARALLRARGLRRTLSRAHVLVCVASFGRPASHAQVTEELGEYGFDESTIFRCLNDLTDAGILKKTNLGDRVWRFGIRKAASNSEATTSLLVCVICGATSSVDAGHALQRGRRDSQDWQFEEVVVRGRCPDCQRMS